MDDALAIAKRFEVKPVRGATEVWFEGMDGMSWLLYRGGPKEARKFMRGVAASIESVIVAQHENGCDR